MRTGSWRATSKSVRSSSLWTNLTGESLSDSIAKPTCQCRRISLLRLDLIGLARGHMELCSFSRVFERTPSVASLQGRALYLRPLTLKPPNITKKRQSCTAPRPSITRRAIRPPPLSTPTKPTATPPRRTLRLAQLIPRARARNRSKRSGGVQPLQTVAGEFEHRLGAGGTR